MEVLLDYSWPGNVRQLESAIERAILLCEGDTILPRDLPQEVLARKSVGKIERPVAAIASRFPPRGSTSSISNAI